MTKRIWKWLVGLFAQDPCKWQVVNVRRVCRCPPVYELEIVFEMHEWATAADRIETRRKIMKAIEKEGISSELVMTIREST